MGENKIIETLLTEFLMDMISLPSLSGKEDRVAVRVKEEFERLGYEEIIEAEGNVCGKRGSGGLIVLYDAHIDVVEPGKGWRADPFKAREENGMIIGRGACDDKGTLAAMIYGGADAETEGLTLYVLGSVKEEVAEGNGIGAFLTCTGIKPDFVIIGEPSSLRVSTGNRGRVGVRIDMKGEYGHASDPQSGVNAIYRAMEVVRKIKDLNQRLDEDTVSVTKIETPNKNLNIIPGECSIYCDYRTGKGRTEQEVFDSLKSFIGPEDDITAVTPYYKPWQMESGHPLVKAAVRCREEVLGKDESIYWRFCTNGSYTAGELGIPSVGFGPGIEQECHSVEEKIDAASVKKAAEFFCRLPEYIFKQCGKT